MYFNLKVVITLKEDIQYLNTYEKISNLIAKAMLEDEKLKKLHETNKYKLYNFCSLYPFEQDGLYKKNKMYAFDIRFIELDFATKMKQLIAITKDNTFKIEVADIQTNDIRHINKLITLTPAICTTEKGDYKIDSNINLIKGRLIDGAEKKYNMIFGEKLSCDFIKSIKQTNIKPIKLPYKNINFLGNKFEIEIKEDEKSQKLAAILFVTGVLEKNSQGYGFCIAR